MPGPAHKDEKFCSVSCAIVTISDTRTAETDAGGSMLREMLQESGHDVYRYRIIPDEPASIRAALIALRDDPRCQAILTTGGTGLAHRDTTNEVVESLLTKKLDGFGELFRMLSYEHIGPAAMLSRAVAGAADDTVVFCMPGSTDAVQLAMAKLILPELAHVARLLGRSDEPA